MKHLKLFNVFGKLKLWQKLTLIAVLTGSTVPFITWQLVKAKNKDITFGQKEVYGAEYLPALRKLHEHVAKHRGLTNGYLHGNSGMKDQIPATQQAINTAFQALSDIDTRSVEDTTYGAMFESSDKVNALKREWEAVRGKSANSTSSQEVFDQHNRLMTSINDLIIHVGDRSNLILDPDLDTYYLMDAVIVQLPNATDALGQVRGLMTGAISGKAISPQEQSQLNFQMARALSALGNVETGMRKAFDANTAMGGDLSSKQQQQLSDAIREAKNFLKKGENFTATAGNADQVFAEGVKVTDRMGMLYDASRNNLEELLYKRINSFKSDRNMVLAFALVGVLLSLATAFVIVRGISSQVNALSYLVKQIELGNVDARAEVISQDELGALATSFNATLDNTRGLLQSRAERDSIQRSIMRLLEEVSTVAEGDLTRQAAVTEDITGAIADSFNFMIAELRRIIGQVKEVTVQVTHAANTTQSSSTELVQKAEQQSQQIHITSQALEEMTVSIQEVSQGAVLSASVAQQSLVNARQGAKAVQDTIKGMNRIREQVQETSGHIRRLGENSEEIGEIVQLIDEIADQTSILALNASIQAATAGDAGRGFAVVAEEIEHLAERASQATAKISSLVKSIQAGTNEAISAMEENNREVIEGSKLALQAGQSLTEIENVSERLADLIQSISQASRKQTNSSETLSKAMTDISHIIKETTTGIQVSAVTVNSLASLADSLRTSVASFKLPQRG
ncbi:MAG: methyl-accepting chemotaxis protein [Blastocatellia bacterium]|nr:methyl-accepting chemotaxis protein [Blastocatellia bacterium]